jgi:sigma-B regulation protein RsbU (phosphoserine phosphatase)
MMIFRLSLRPQLMQKKSQDELLRAGATNIISKPIDFEILSIRIKGHLEHRILMQSLKAYQQRVQKN